MADRTPEFATPDALPSVEYVDMPLDALGKWVHVRFLGSPDMASLSTLPELRRFSELMSLREEINARNAKRDQDKPAEKMSEQDSADLVAERTRYLTRAAHLAVIRDPADTAAVDCPDCAFPHRRSLWSLQQVGFLNYRDLEAIVEIAERQRQLDPTSDSSPDPMEDDTDSSAVSGELTPAPTS